MEEWCTIESDPGVFTELINQIGVKGVEVEEIYSFDSLEEHKPVYGLIFLFKWVPSPPRECLEFYDPELFFANQVIQNACATQAIISVLLNCDKIDIGSELTNLKEFGLPLDPQTRGLSFGNSETIRHAHNSFGKQEYFEFAKTKPSKKEEAYHFISFIPFRGKLYELDGLQPGPILLGECNEDDWLEKVRPVIQARIETYAENEIRFNLLAVVSSKKENANNAISVINTQIAAIQCKLGSLGESIEDAMEVDFDEEYFNSLPDDVASLKSELFTKQEAFKEQQAVLDEEEHKHTRWREENVRRKHNYIPFIVALLDKLAEKKQLMPLLEQAKKRQNEKQSSS